MIKELLVYRKPEKEFKLIRWEKVTDKHRRLYFESEHELDYDNLIWAKKDYEDSNRKNILVVEHAYEDGSVRVRLSDESFMHKLRNFEADEVFYLIASFKEKANGNSGVHIS